ncbi:hypothetical protein ACVILH_001167 [Bradyrhizobium sp. USDA 4353]
MMTAGGLLLAKSQARELRDSVVIIEDGAFTPAEIAGATCHGHSLYTDRVESQHAS